jgi:hypothetical protein
MNLSELESSKEFDTERVQKCLALIENILASTSLNVGELLLLYGNLGYKLGANLRRALYDKDFISEPPNIEELNKLYYSNPAEDVALMITGLTVTSWLDTILEREKK